MSFFPQLRNESQVARWDPFNGASSIFDAFNDVFNTSWPAPIESKWNPPLDIIENDKEVVLKMDVPGMENKDIHVEINNGALVIRGERKYEKEHKDDNYLCIERRYGQFARSFRLPDYVDQDHVKAECKHGLLQVHLSKKPGKKKDVKEISVSS
ncbi:Hsp20/alpha crystallin family protein [Pseudidiomarina sp.]|uniref:Hsp20/alpha crystallin family protein n=1 Tax=Pseudidiomarina sp. TaxID=2081707 RepID=UPI003A987215